MKKTNIRNAKFADALRIAELLGQLGYPNTADFARSKVSELERSPEDVLLVAERDGVVVGAAHLHLTRLLHERGRMGRVAALVVSENARRLGIGRALMGAAERIAGESGCTRMELTSNVLRDEAHAFYRALGYVESPRRFVKRLDEK